MGLASCVLPHGGTYVTATVRITAGINKAADADALRRVSPTVLASYLEFRGWVRQEP